MGISTRKENTVFSCPKDMQAKTSQSDIADRKANGVRQDEEHAMILCTLT